MFQKPKRDLFLKHYIVEFDAFFTLIVERSKEFFQNLRGFVLKKLLCGVQILLPFLGVLWWYMEKLKNFKEQIPLLLSLNRHFS